jgi:ribonuclease Z
MFCYICDTSIAILSTYPQIFNYPIIIIECTFLYPDERENAVATKHIHWEELLPYVIQYSNIIFVLIHFSLRYKDAEILEFFNIQKDIHNISNIKVWAGETDTQFCQPCVTADSKLSS